MAPRSKTKGLASPERVSARPRSPGVGAGPRPGTRTLPAQAHPIRVLCVDDHLVLIEGLKARFSMDGGIEVVGQLMNAERLVQEVGRLRPDVVTLDIEMPGPDAFEIADRLKREYPEVSVIVLSAHIRDAYISASFRSGVCAYFAKSDELGDIVRGIYEVAHQKTRAFLLGPKVSERCRPIHGKILPGHVPVGERHPESPAGIPETLTDSLTPRELEILRLIGKGLSRTQIAAQLCRSTKTVDAHQGRMMRKLGISARADLMRFAIREGLAQA